MADEAMYPEAAEATPSEAPEKPSEDTPEDSETKDEGETVLVSKSALGSDCKVGETYSMKVVGIYDDEVELSKVKSGGEKSEDTDDADSDIEAMATESE